MGGLGLGMTLGSAVVVIDNVWWRFTVRRWRYRSDLLIDVARSLSKFGKNRQVECDAEAGTGRLM